MYAFIVGFNGWVLKSFVKEMESRRTKSKDVSGWEHDGQVIRELKTLQALTGMHGRNWKLIVVKPSRRLNGDIPLPGCRERLRSALVHAG